MAVRARINVKASEPYKDSLRLLAESYPDVRQYAVETEDALRLGYPLPQMPVDTQRFPGVFAIMIDYPPLGSAGRCMFCATYLADGDTYIMLSITKP